MKKHILKRYLSIIKRPSTRYGVGVLIAVGFVGGIAFWLSFESFVRYSSTMEFCIGCHEMNDFVFAEYQQSAHYTSRSGVRPDCDDCHIPKAFIPKLKAKIRATYIEIPKHLMGTVSTIEKFEARREHLAHRVWNRMRANDSLACRNCHDENAMSEDDQALRSVREHQAGKDNGETCIDCHQGIAHQLPASMLETEEEEMDFDF